MPIYEYLCDSCNHKLEIIQKISEEPMRFCPECGKEALRKLISPVSFRLKGTGWYETDFKNKPKSNSESRPDTGEKPKEKEKNSKVETKAADNSG